MGRTAQNSANNPMGDNYSLWQMLFRSEHWGPRPAFRNWHYYYYYYYDAPLWFNPKDKVTECRAETEKTDCSRGGSSGSDGTYTAVSSCTSPVYWPSPCSIRIRKATRDWQRVGRMPPACQPNRRQALTDGAVTIARQQTSNSRETIRTGPVEICCRRRV